MKVNQKKLEKSQIEIEFELTPEEFQKHTDRALLHLKDHVKMDGFRPGQVPLKIVEEKVGNEKLLMEAGDLAVKESYTKFVNENNLEPIGQPEVQITKIAKGNPFLFKVKISVLPELELPDYKSIAAKVKGRDVSVDEKEIEEALNYLQKSRAKFSDKEKAENKDYVKIEYQNEKINQGKPVKDMFILGEGGFLKDFEDNLLGMKRGEEKEFTAKFPDNASNELGGKEGKFKVKMEVIQKMELPEINDEFAKSLGVFDSLAALKNNLKGGITTEKSEAEKQRKRGEVLEKIAEKINFELPEKMVEYEQKRLLEELESQVIQNANVAFEDYLKSIKKTEGEIEKSFKLEAEKRIRNFLVLRQVGKAEKVEVSNEEMEAEMNRVVKNYSKESFGTAQGKLDKIDINQLKEYTKGVVFNEKVFEKLESFSK